MSARPVAWLAAVVAGGVMVGLAVAALASYGDRRQAEGYKAGQAEVQARWSAETNRLQRLALEEQEKARLELLSRQAAEQKAANEQTQRETRLRLAADRSRTAVSLLQQQLDAVVRSAAGGEVGSRPAVAGGRSAVETLGELFGQCVTRYRGLAESADRDRSAGLRCEQQYDALSPGS